MRVSASPVARVCLRAMQVARLPAAIAVTVSVALGVAACGGGSNGNGVQSKSPAAIIRATTGAAESLKSVHVDGSFTQGASTIGMNLRMVAGTGAIGSMSQQGRGFRLVLLHNTLYIDADASFWRAYGNAAAAALLKGRWLRTPATGSYASIAQIGNLRGFFRHVFGQHGTLSKTPVRTIAGTRAVGLTDTTQGGTLYVATTGKPYPLELTNGAGKTTGKLSFTSFNQPVRITAPKGSISLAQLQRAG